MQTTIMKNTLLAGLALAITTSLASAAGEGWLTDFEEARKKAAAENKDLLLDFTGSDWCPPCKKLTANILSKDEFKKGAAAKFILVELDFPNDKSKISETTQKQNLKLQELYNIKGYPTILLTDSKGRPYGQTGYREDGPKEYLAHLDELHAKRLARDEAFAAAEKLQGIQKAKALVAALRALPEDQLSHYSDVTKQITALDPRDESGFIAAQKRKDARAALEKEVMTAMQSGKNADAIASIDQFITDYKAKGEEKQELLGMKMNPLLTAKKFDEAAKIIDEIIAAAPESRAAKFAENFKPRLQQMKAQAEAQKNAEEAPKEERQEETPSAG